jgi:hypothetical protein
VSIVAFSHKLGGTGSRPVPTFLPIASVAKPAP